MPSSERRPKLSCPQAGPRCQVRRRSRGQSPAEWSAATQSSWMSIEAEMTEHLGYDKHEPAGRNGGNSRNGTRTKTVLTEMGRSRSRCRGTGTARSTRGSCVGGSAGWTVSTSCRCPRGARPRVRSLLLAVRADPSSRTGAWPTCASRSVTASRATRGDHHRRIHLIEGPGRSRHSVISSSTLSVIRESRSPTGRSTWSSG